MKRLIIIVEGQTEENFVNISLRNYFGTKGIYDISAIKIQTSKGNKGGFVSYAHLKNDLQKILREPNVIVTTFLDFFRIPTSVPNYHDMDKYPNVDDKIDTLIKGMKNDINDHRFVAYIQKFEFEALLFSSNEGFEKLYQNSKISEATATIINKYDNPEEINNHPETAPSKRIIKILAEQGERYDKVTEGNLMAEVIGFEKIMNKCPRFRSWIQLLEFLVTGRGEYS